MNPPSPLRVRPLPVIFASVVAVAVFVVVLAVVARLTADGVVMPRPDAGPEADAGVLEGGDIDAGVVELVTVEPGPDAGPEPDGGPPTVEPPPYDPAVVAAAAVVVVESCVKDALRWDPSLGGAFTLRVILPVTPLTTSERELEEPGDADDDGPPPVLQTPGLGLPAAARHRHGPRPRHARPHRPPGRRRPRGAARWRLRRHRRRRRRRRALAHASAPAAVTVA
jgi:hypothetical protein